MVADGDCRQSLAIPDFRATMPDGSAVPQLRQDRGATVGENQERLNESPNYIVFPMAVGALFLAFLVAGALLG